MSEGFDGILAKTLEFEGGWSDHPADNGGKTKYGVTQATLSRYLGRAATDAEIRNLSKDVAKDIYETMYFRGPRIDSLPHPLQSVIFDISVNSGPSRAIKMLQTVCAQAGFDPKGIDGRVGPGTRSAVDAAYASMGDWLIASVCWERLMFYHAIIRAKPSQAAFKKGWERRAFAFWPESVEVIAA